MSSKPSSPISDKDQKQKLTDILNDGTGSYENGDIWWL